MGGKDNRGTFKIGIKMKRSPDLLNPKKQLFLFFDYDGTLCPIAPHPQLARLKKSVKKLLRILCSKKGIRIAVISGRALKDVKKLVGLKDLIYAGNHGLEIKGPSLNFLHPRARHLKPVLDRVYKVLKKDLRSFSSALIEHKGLSLSLHYRLLKGKDVPAFKRSALKELRKHENIKITFGKKVIEARPRIDWNKGRALKKILFKKGKGFLPIYFGDDITDLDAFKVLRKKGVCVWVGKKFKGIKADLYLKDPKEVEKLLEQMVSES